MGKLFNLIKGFKSFNAKDIAKESIIETKGFALDEQARQMNKGKRNDGSDILPSYSRLTIEIKEQNGQVTDRVTLHDTGAFYAGFKLDIQGEQIQFTSTDSKTAKLKKKYNTSKGKIFGLNDESKKEYINESLKKKFVFLSRKKIYGK